MNTDNLRVKWIEVEASVWEAQQAELKALQEENDRLKERELDQIAGIEGLNALIADLESQLAELRQGGEAGCVGKYRVCNQRDNTGVIADLPEHTVGTDVFVYSCRQYAPQPAIPPGYVGVPDTTDEWRKLALQYDAQRMLFRDLLKWVDKHVSCAMSDQIRQALASAPAIQPQAAAPVSEKDVAELEKRLISARGCVKFYRDDWYKFLGRKGDAVNQCDLDEYDRVSDLLKFIDGLIGVDAPSVPPGYVVPDAMTFLRDNDLAASDDWMQGWNDCRAMLAAPADSKEGE